MSVKNRQTGEMEALTKDSETEGLEVVVRGGSPLRLAGGVLSDSAASVFVAGAETRNVILMVCNTTAVAVNLTVYHLPSGASVADGYALCKAYSVPANSAPETVLPFGITLQEGDDIQALGSTASALTMAVYGEPQ